MQLRIARLCLDCEEVFTGESCPVCASTHYAFLSQWLPSEERRRWRRPGPRPSSAPKGFFQNLRFTLARWLGEAEPNEARRGLRTRRSDYLPDMSFREPAKAPPAKPAPAPEPVKTDV